MPPVDLHPPADPEGWIGIEFDVHGAGRDRRPMLHVEYAKGGRFRVRHADRSLLIARVERWYRGLWWWRVGDATESLGILPPIRAARARTLGGNLRGWGWAFEEMLRASPRTLLHSGRWHLEPLVHAAPPFDRHPLVRPLEFCLTARAGYSKWTLSGSGDVFALRTMSAPDASRVKVWRKHAREGDLPPVLLYFVSGMDSWLLVDGHDRLQAALLEGVRPSALLLSSVRTKTWPDDPAARARVERALALQLDYPLGSAQLDGVNRRLVALYADRSIVHHPTRAWSISGGPDAWLREAQALIANGAPPELAGDV